MLIDNIRDLEIRRHVLLLPLAESISQVGRSSVLYYVMERDLGAEEAPDWDEYFSAVREYYSDPGELDVQVSGLIVLTSESPIFMDVPPDTRVHNAITISLVTPEGWNILDTPSNPFENAEQCVVDISRVELDDDDEVLAAELAISVHAATPEGSKTYGPIIFSSESPISMYRGGLYDPNPDFDVLLRRMLITKIVDATLRQHMDAPDDNASLEDKNVNIMLRNPLALITYALTEISLGKCASCNRQDCCIPFLVVSAGLGDDISPERAGELLRVLEPMEMKALSIRGVNQADDDTGDD